MANKNTKIYSYLETSGGQSSSSVEEYFRPIFIAIQNVAS